MKRNTVGLQSLPEVRRKAYAAVEAAIQNHFLLKTTPRNQFNIMKKNAKPILGGYACVRFPFFRILTLAFLLAATSLAWAQDYPVYDSATVAGLPEWDGTSVNGPFKISNDIEISSTVIIQNTTLSLYPMKNPTTGRNPTITKKVLGSEIGVDSAKLFYLYDTGKLFIIGNEKNKLNIYGNCGNGIGETPTPIPTSTTYQGAAIYARNGTPEIWLKHVEFYGFITHTDMSNGGVKGDSHGGIVTMGHHSFATNTNGICNMDHVTFRDNFGGPINTNSNQGFGRIISFVNGSWTVTLDNVTIRDCIISEKLHGNHYNIGGMGSAIRSQGNVGGSLTMRNCEAYNNTYRDLSRHGLASYSQWGMDSINAQPLSGQGGVVNWRSGRQNNSGGDAFVSIQDCNFHHNSARCGGAVATCAYINMGNTNIHHNEAEQGGGVYFYTYNGTDRLYDGNGFRATFEGGVNIHHNSASKYGGGAYLTFDASNDVGFTPGNVPMSPEFSLNINAGSEIHDNKAPKGSGIALVDGCPYSHYYSAISKWSLEYQRTVTLNGGHVYDNYAQDTEGSEMAGGGIYIEKYEYSSGHPLYGFHSDYIASGNSDPNAANNSGTLTVNLTKGEVYNNTAVNNTKSGKGGGVYIASKFETNTILSTLNVNIGAPGEILQMYKNQAYTDGGGVYVWYDREDNRKNNGTVTVKGGTIGKTDLATGNKALHGNGGGICVMSGTVVVENGHVDYNTANQNGGGIYLNDGDLTITGGFVDYNEASNNNGGGICVMSGTVGVEGGHVDYNTANQMGGGIYLNDGNLTFTGGFVDSNEASNNDGGGICVEGGNIVVSGGTVSNNKAELTNGGGVCVLGGTVLVEGGHIISNTAKELGGGVYVSVPNEETTTIIQGVANISLNTAKGGGGVYVDKGLLTINGPAFSTGIYGQNEANNDNTHTRITKNTASDGNGGGINAGNGKVDLINTLIYHNTASGTVSKGRGGGVYLDGGIIEIVSSKILYNTAKTNGGGIDDHSGDIEIYGGDISHNTATTGRGGGVYTNAGDIRIWPSALYNNPAPDPYLEQCENTGTVFSYNTAGTNGGGINTHIGRLDVRFAKVHDNVAGHNYSTIGTQGGSGGGMFCEGPHADLSGYTVRLLYTDLNDNKAYGSGGSGHNLTGRGGGLYLKYGSIFAEHCDILRNEADINGGGLDNHDGELRVYGSFVDNNKAKNGRGGGLYTDKGNLVVGPCDSYGFVNSKASRICNNTAFLNGGGINNHEGNITIHGDRINNNTAQTGKGGGVYINSGNIYMYGGQINNNHADDPSGGYGGGVYGGGGTFNIMEREAHPILEILEVEKITTSGFTVHFHHVDRGFAMESGATEKEYGIAYSKNPYPSNLGENVDWTGHWDDVTTIGFAPSAGQPTPPAPHSYNQYEGCSRFEASGLTSGKTYYVVAYGKYRKGDKNYFDASPAVKVKTHGDNPVVVTGVAFDITTNSASVNGKLFYEGVGTQLKKGIEILSDDGLTWVKHQAESVGDVFSVTFSGLESSKIYKARAYATCQDGDDVYESQDAEIITFFTYGNSPVVATGEASEITTNSATVSGELLYEGVGSGTVTKGISYWTGEGEWTNVASTDTEAEFSVTLTGLDPGTTYQAQAYATKGENTVYGEIITFTTATGSKAPQGPRSVYPAVEENPFFQELTPLQQAIMASTPEEDTTTRRSRNGRPSDEEPVNIPQINNNTAAYGGGICIDKQGANLIFSGKRGAVEPNEKIGQINNNYASEAGGGIYIGRESADQYAQMQMMGRCEVNKNHVPADKHGGGIYLDGRLYVGDKNTDNPVYDEEENPNPIIHGLRVDRNFTSSISHEEWLTFTESTWESSSFTPGKFNNVFLTRYDYDYYVNINNGAPGDNNVSVITLLSDISGTDANDNPYSHIGFSVLKGFCPVIATASEFGGAYNTVESIIDTEHPENTVIDQYENWLYKLMILSGAGDDGMAETMRGAVFEDSESYVAVHTRQNIPPFLGKFIYLWGCWTHPVVMKDPETDNPMGKLYKYGTTDAENKFKGHYKIRNSFTEEGNPGYTATSQTPLEWEIYSPEGLSWFTSYVNGLNAFDQKDGGMTTDNEGNPIPDPNHFKWNANQNPKANAIIMNDLDMSAYLWVPIGSVQKFYKVATDGGSLFKDSDDVPDAGYTQYNHYYKGTFDGQGHIIKGLQGLYLTGIVKYGLFGYLAEGAEVKNTFVDEGLFISDNSNIEYSAGGIAGEMKAGTIKNSEARMDFNITYSGVNTKVGGLVGDVQGGDIHSSMAMPTFTGKSKYMGGLVGNLAANRSLRNSFANSLFLEDSYPNYVGGLVGNNSGTVENCYSRYQGTTIPTGFGWFAGTNNYVETTVGVGDEQTTEITGVINYCYAPNGETIYIGNNATTGLTGHGNYDPTVWVSGKYGFKHRDHKITAAKIDENEYTTLLITDIDDAYESGLTNQSFGGGGSNSGNNGSTSPQPATLSTTTSGGLMTILNAWVELNYKANEAGKDYATWTRTMASPINDDYPVPMLTDFNSVGSKDKIYLLYEDDVNHMWNPNEVSSTGIITKPGKNFKAFKDDENTVASMYLYDVQPIITPASGTTPAVC